MGLGAGTVIIAVSFVLAALTHHLVEQPILRRRTGRQTGYRLAVAATATVLLLAATWQVIAVQQAQSAAATGDLTHPGARALLTGAVDPAPLLRSQVRDQQ